MASNAADVLNDELAEMIRNDLAVPSVTEPDRSLKRPATPAMEKMSDPALRLPRRITGGFRGLGDDLDRRARDWRNMVRLLEQLRPYLESAELERDRAYTTLGRVLPEVQESGRALKAALDAGKTGDISDDLTGHFNKNLRALDELESVAEALTSNLISIRTAWEQYARSILKAQKMRDDLKQEAS